MRTFSTVRLAAAALLTLVLAVSVTSVPASAAPGSPTGLSPTGTSVSDVPILQWNRVARAGDYEVQVSANPSYSTLAWQTITANRRATPTVQLPAGTLYWRVRARDASGNSPWSEASFTRSALTGPAPLAPADGALLDPPEEPTLLAWEPRRGAVSYTVEVSTDRQFVDSSVTRTYTTQASSYVVPDPVVATDYYWRVRADIGNGVLTQWSVVRSYRMGGLDRPALTSPSLGEKVIDVALDWEPVKGARSYNVQISTDRNFNTFDHTAAGVLGTRYSPASTLNNDQYYWRVAPVDSAGNTLDWEAVEVWEFQRHWPRQPALEYPADNDTVGDPFFYQWTPVEHASSYKLEVSTNREFSDSGRFATCSTVQTTYTPTGYSDCFPAAPGTYYWRVVALDNPTGVQTDAISAEVHRFTYNPDLVTMTSPAPGATVQVPTLRWDPKPGAAAYDVEITREDLGVSSVVRTNASSWTPRSPLEAGKSYRWNVRTVSPSGRLGPWLLPASQPRFTVEAQPPATATTPEPTTPDAVVSDRFPTLSWTPVVSATQYAIEIRPQGNIGWSTLGDRFQYPSGQDTGTGWLSPGTYQWRVVAYDTNGAYLSQSLQSRTFVIASSRQVTGQRLAMQGTASASPTTSCSKALDPGLPVADQQCTGLRATPVLRWDSEPDTSQYVLRISRDQQMTNVLATYVTDQHLFIPPTALIDSQAGSAFYWSVQPCKVPGSCRAQEHARHAFNKISHPVELVAPAQDATVANAVTFTWRDYLQTNQDAAGDATGVRSVDADVEAQQYRVQVDDDPNFQSPLETVIVDQMTYTSASTTYPEGPLYWRVQALDGSGNPLSWSTPGRFTKRSPQVTLVSPTGDGTTSGSSPLRWGSLAYAASYDVEVYKNADTIGQAGNLVYSGTSTQVATTPVTPFPVSDQSYTWRVRPRDAAGRPGPWTDLGAASARFRVVGQAPALTSPQPGSLQVSNDVLFTWSAVDGAADYRYERRLVGGSGLAEAVRTPGLAWAPSAVGDGRWEWRVVALNAAGADLGASAWSGFSVDQTQPVVQSVKPASGLVKRSATFTLTFSEAVSGVTRTSVTIAPYGARKKLAAVVKPTSGGTKVTINPSKSLKRGKSYSLKVTGKVKDSAGNPLVPYAWIVTAK